MEMEGTELVDVYGTFTSLGALLHKLIAQTTCSNSSSSVSQMTWKITHLTGEAGTGKSCLLYHCINDTCGSKRCEIGLTTQSRRIPRIP